MPPAKDVLQDILFEIGTEELPATNLADIFESAASEKNALEIKLRQAFENARIPFRDARVWATPRRLLFCVEGAAAAQTRKEELNRLLSEEEAYGPDGKPTEKFSMILERRNVSLKDTVVSDFNGKPYVFARKTQAARKTAAVLPEILETLVKSLSFPKNMKWDDSGIFFPRPIRHAFCFCGSRPISFKLGRLRSGSETALFSKSRRTRCAVKDPRGYFELLKKKNVILNPAERKKAIEEILNKLAKSLGGERHRDAFLLNEVNFLVESPEGIAAPFHQEFLRLPAEVLTVSMARKQRIFGLIGKDGRVLPHFLAILDGRATDKEKRSISKNYENILHAKLQDSLFFYNEDVKVSLEKKRAELKDLVFLKGAGSMLEKSERLVRLAKKILKGETLERAAFLCKSDLLTQMVGEFPELQGIIGKYYARENGENAEVAEAIGEQYLPRTVGDKLPESPNGALLSLLDKFDLITACFGLGFEPTSSLDPYGLRRSASAILKILTDKNIDLSLSELSAASQRELGSYVLKDKAEALPRRLKQFFGDRFKTLLVERGYREDLVDAVLGTCSDRPREALLRLEALTRVSGGEAFSNACKVVERTHNILKGSKEPLPEAVDPGVFSEELERQVFGRYQKFLDPVQKAVSAGDFAQATSLYAEAFFAILNEFFEKVFINAEDLRVRKNRLALLKSIKELYTKDIADLSKIHPTRT